MDGAALTFVRDLRDTRGKTPLPKVDKFLSKVRRAPPPPPPA